MSRLRVAPIVEGHGECEAVRTLLQRIWHEMLHGEHIDVLRPIREPRAKIIRQDTLSKKIDLAARKLSQNTVPGDRNLIFILLDADKDLPCILAPQILERAVQSRSDMDLICVIANPEYETWFVGACESLRDFLHFESHDVPRHPEQSKSRKAWIENHFKLKNAVYSETIDQPRMTAKMDLSLCRKRCPSFDKLCRELEKRI